MQKKEFKTLITDSGKTVYHFKAAYFSDTHLGSRNTQEQNILWFLDHVHFDYGYILGDFIDGWSYSSTNYWNQNCTDIIQKLLKKTRKGTRLIYLTGNHDEFVANFLGNFGSLEIMDYSSKVIHGKKIIFLHGHQFDTAIKNYYWLSRLGTKWYERLYYVNKLQNKIRRLFGFDQWSLNNFIKTKVKNTLAYINNYENIVKTFAKSKGYQGIICGHLHIPLFKKESDFWYLNTGDFVEHSTAILEDFDNQFYLVQIQDNQLSVIDSFDFSAG